MIISNTTTRGMIRMHTCVNCKAEFDRPFLSNATYFCPECFYPYPDIEYARVEATKNHETFFYFCKICERVTVWRYLDCEYCREHDRECIYICRECGEGL